MEDRLTEREFKAIKKHLLPCHKIYGFVRIVRTKENGERQILIPCKEGGYKWIKEKNDTN